MHSALSCAKTVDPIEMLFGLWDRIRPRNHEVDGVQIPKVGLSGNFDVKGGALQIGTFCRELCKNG